MIKKVIVVVAMMLFAGIASADVIGFFADQEGGVCTENIMPYVAIDIYLMAVLNETFDGGITAAEFSVANYIGNPGYPVGQVTAVYTSTLIIGNLVDGFSIAWSTPQGAGFGSVLIGSFNILAFDAAWIGPDFMMQVVPAADSGTLATVDNLYNIWPAVGGLFWFNCTDMDACFCIEPTATQDSSWSAVKSLF